MNSFRISVCLATWLVLLAWVPGLAQDTWTLPELEFEIEGEHLDRERILTRIDSLEQALGSLAAPQRTEAQWRLAQLYASTDMHKHRRHALDLIDEVTEAEPDRVEAHWLWADLAGSMEYHSAMIDRMKRVLTEDPEQVDAAIMMGHYEFRRAARRLSAAQMRTSREFWRSAVEIDSTRSEIWHGLAATTLALGYYRASRRAAQSLAREDEATGLFLEAAAHERLGDHETAWARYTEALQIATPEEQGVFRMGEGFLSADDLEEIARAVITRPEAFAVLQEQGQDPQPGDELDWERVLRHPGMRERVLAEWWAIFDQRPAQGFSTGELEYWTRLVEADVLFGRPWQDTRGWNTPVGRVWVRWGRPTTTFYDPGSAGAASRIDALQAAGVRFPTEHFLPPNGPPIWVWTYRWPGTWISFLFSDASRTSAWSPSESSSRDLADLRAIAPLRFPAIEEVRPFEVALSAVAFPRDRDDAVVETYVGFEPTTYILDQATGAQEEQLWYADRDTLALLEWSVTDLEGRELDRVERVVDRYSRLSSVLADLGRPLARDAMDPFLISIGARLPAGRYRIAVEVTEPITGLQTSAETVVGVPGAEPGELLEMSGLQLATAFVPGAAGTEVPDEFLKYTAAVIPAPDHHVPLDSPHLGVYFELRNLALDNSGQANFDVRYAVYSSNREIRDLAFQDEPDLDGLQLVAPASMTFLEERSGRSPEGLVIKGTEIDVSGLEAGDYVLVVSINDRISRDSASRAAAFRVSSR